MVMADHDQVSGSMTAAVHARALELAAVAIDFELAVDEAAELAHHLDDCEPCRTDAQLLRSDAAALAALPQVDAPSRVRSAVVAGRRPGRIGPMQPLAVALIVAVLTLVPLSATLLLNGGFSCCNAGAGATGAPATGAPATGVPGATPHVEPTNAPTLGPTPPATTGPSPTPSPTPTPSPGTAAPEPFE